MVVLPFYYILRAVPPLHAFPDRRLARHRQPLRLSGSSSEHDAGAGGDLPGRGSLHLLHPAEQIGSPGAAVSASEIRDVRPGGACRKTCRRPWPRSFHPARLFVMYGATEAAPRLTYVEPEMLPRKWGSIGRAIPGMEVMVADEQGRRVPPRVQGEIVARGPSIMMGYWKDPEATAQVLRHGYYFTGDLGFADEDGYMFLTGRARDMIKTGGNRVSAKEIEDVVSSIPGVLETAVIGVAGRDSRRGHQGVPRARVSRIDRGLREERVEAAPAALQAPQVGGVSPQPAQEPVRQDSEVRVGRAGHSTASNFQRVDRHEPEPALDGRLAHRLRAADPGHHRGHSTAAAVVSQARDCGRALRRH